MKKVFVFVLVLVLTGCASTRQVTQLVHDIQRDTVYLSNVQYDSIYIYQGFEKDYRRDLHKPLTINPQPLVGTVYLKDVSVEYRYKLLRDTVHIVQRDSIPYEVTIVETKEITRPLTWFDHLTRACFWVLVGVLIYYLIRLIRKVRSL